jgi:phosphate transport system substrate-binding protein
MPDGLAPSRFFRRMPTRLVLYVLIFGAASGMAFLVPPVSAGTVSVKGSDTMVVLGQRWAEEFMKSHPNIVIQVQGGGSGTGIAALVNGTIEICQASRAMKDVERAQVSAKAGTPPLEYSVARDGLSVYVNSANKLSELTMAQLKDIFSGKTTNWKEVGGADQKIALYSRENNSGTYVFFKEHVLENADYSPRAQTLPGTAAVVNAVVKDRKAIGFGGGAYAKGLKVLKIKKDVAGPAIAPSEATVKDGTYALSRPLFLYTRSSVSPDAKTFIDWVLSPPGQSVVTKVGYFPIH